LLEEAAQVSVVFYATVNDPASQRGRIFSRATCRRLKNFGLANFFLLEGLTHAR